MKVLASESAPGDLGHFLLDSPRVPRLSQGTTFFMAVM